MTKATDEELLNVAIADIAQRSGISYAGVRQHLEDKVAQNKLEWEMLERERQYRKQSFESLFHLMNSK